MQTLIFDSTLKTVKLYEGEPENSKVLITFDGIPTVKSSQEGFYEVYQRPTEYANSIPVARFPIANTNMYIKK
jgi:hypothetical protein